MKSIRMTNVVFPVFHSDCKKCNSIWWLLIASLYLCIYLFGSSPMPHWGLKGLREIYLVACEQALLGVGGGRGKEDLPPRELACSLSIWGNWRCWRLSLLKDCRLYAPHSQIWPEYKLETASCLVERKYDDF